MEDNSKLKDLEEKFCWVYACGPVPYVGNAPRSYELVFKKSSGKLIDVDDNAVEEDIDTNIAARKLMARKEIQDRIDEIQSMNAVNATTLRPRLTETLLKIADECTTLSCHDKWGNLLSPAALRSVAVSAVSKLTDMYGIKEDIAHKVMLEGSDGDGITFNVIMPQKENDTEAVI